MSGCGRRTRLEDRLAMVKMGDVEFRCVGTAPCIVRKPQCGRLGRAVNAELRYGGADRANIRRTIVWKIVSSVIYNATTARTWLRVGLRERAGFPGFRERLLETIVRYDGYGLMDVSERQDELNRERNQRQAGSQLPVCSEPLHHRVNAARFDVTL